MRGSPRATRGQRPSNPGRWQFLRGPEIHQRAPRVALNPLNVVTPLRLGAFALLSWLIAVALPLAPSVHAQMLFGEKSYEYAPADVLPGAANVVRQDTYWEARGRGDDPIGYVFLTDDLVEVPGYSGHTLNTLVGLDAAGKITGVKIVHHSEPIVLIGLDEKVIHDFVAQYPGRDIRDRIIISNTPKPGYVAVDGISGATVTAMAENATILAAGRKVGRAVGIVQAAEIRNRLPSMVFQPLDWAALVKRGALGRLVVQPEALHQEGDGPALDLHFAVLDPAAIGQNLLGERYYQIVQERLQGQGGCALFIAASGSASFKGAGFARGGIFDRFSLEQGGDLFVFQDLDYLNHTDLEVDGGPAFREGGIFFLKNPAFDPTRPFTFHLTLPYRVGDRKEYATFLGDYALPAAFVEEEVPFWVSRWREIRGTAAAFGLFLSGVAVLFLLRPRLLPYRKWIHRAVAVVAVGWVGWLLKAQPSTTQILTPANSAVHGKFPCEVFLSEPLIFLFWIAILLSLPLWGRGFFCGWLCPYGALLELLASLWHKVAPRRLQRRIDRWDPPYLRYGKYAFFLVIFAVALVNLPLAEMLDEVEPFKTFILHLARPSHFVAYFAVVTLASMVVYRGFCRFLCPLGGALAIPSLKPFLPLKRYEQCATCKICYKGCEPKAIARDTGRIDYHECLQCWDCQNTGEDVTLCPELILARKEGRAPRRMAALLVIGLLVTASSAAAHTWTVTPEGPSLPETIAASTDGDTIQLAAGVYLGGIVIDKRLTLTGVEGAIIDGGGHGHVVAVRASEVTVEGLTLRGSGSDPESSDAGIWVAQEAANVRLLHNRIEGCWFGIWIHGSDHPTLIGNRIAGRRELPSNDRGDGIHLWDVTGAVVRDNTVLDSRDGIYMELSHDCRVVGNTIRRSRYSVHTMWCDGSTYDDNIASENLVGLALMFSKRIEARRNTLYDNRTHGILLVQVTRSVAEDNRIIANTKGLFVYNSLYNQIRHNLVARNHLGMHYWGGSEDNEVADNAFVDNQIQVKFVAARDQSWDGNYWSDYAGWDLDGNGRGDAPYLSNTLVDTLLWKYPAARFLLTSPAFQLLAAAEREFPVIAVPKGMDHAPRIGLDHPEWQSALDRYPVASHAYYGDLSKLPHIPGER